MAASIITTKASNKVRALASEYRIPVVVGQPFQTLTWLSFAASALGIVYWLVHGWKTRAFHRKPVVSKDEFAARSVAQRYLSLETMISFRLSPAAGGSYHTHTYTSCADKQPTISGLPLG